MGYKLTPFSLRHMLYLQALNSPFVESTGRPPTPNDILVFLRICSSTHPSEAFTNVTLMDKFRVAMMDVSIPYYYKGVTLIKEYIEACTTQPKTYEKEDGQGHKKNRESIPASLSIATSLMSKLNMTKDEVWDLTLGQAVWYLTAYAISEGADIKILTTDAEARANTEREILINFQKKELAKYKDNPNG